MAAVILGVMTAVIYFPAMTADFVWDDLIPTTLKSVQDWDGILRLWLDPIGAYDTDGIAEGHYWPVTYSTFWLEHKLWGYDPIGFHVVNVVLYMVSVLVLWRLLHYMNIPGAWLAAALFATHPVHVESVAWVISRKDMLSGLFYLTAWFTYIRYTETRSTGRYVGVLALFVMGMLCKSIVVTLPMALAIWHWWRQGHVTVANVARLAPLLVIGVAIAVADFELYRSREQVNFDFSLIERVLLAAQSFWFYVGKLLWPTGLAIIYPHWDTSTANGLAWLCVAGVIAIFSSFWLLRHRIGRGPLAALLFFAVTLSPSLGFVDFGYMQFSYVADRYQYLASGGVIALIAGTAVHLGSRLQDRMRMGMQGVAALVLLVLGVLTWNQASVYEDEETFFSHIVSLNPNARSAHVNLARYLFVTDRFDEVRDLATIGVNLRQDDASAHNLLGLLHLNNSEYVEAERRFREAVRIRPKDGKFVQNLGESLRRQDRYEEALQIYNVVPTLGSGAAISAYAGIGYCLFELGRYEEMISTMKQVLSLNPEFIELHQHLFFLMGWALKQTGSEEEAAHYLYELSGRDRVKDFFELAENLRGRDLFEDSLEIYRQVIEWDPEHERAFAGLGDALYRLERYEQATDNLEKALALQSDPSRQTVLRFLIGDSALMMGRREEAERQYQVILQANPDYWPAHSRIAELHFHEKRFQKALELYERIIEANPDDASALANLGAVLFMLEQPDEALRALDRALELNPDLSTAKTNHSEVLRAIERTEPPAE